MKHLERSYKATAAVLAAIPADRWTAPSPCAEWTVREVANHLVGAMQVFAAAIDSGDAAMEGDHLGADPAGAYRAAADRCLAAFARPGALAAVHPFALGPTPGQVIADISLSETLVHGWDLAQGAGVPYTPDPAAVAAVTELQRAAAGQRPEGMFDDPVPTPPDADELTELLGLLGRRAA